MSNACCNLDSNTSSSNESVRSKCRLTTGMATASTETALESSDRKPTPQQPPTLQGTHEGDTPSPQVLKHDKYEYDATNRTPSSTSTHPTAHSALLATEQTTTCTGTSENSSTSKDYRKIFVGGLPTDGKRNTLGLYNEMYSYRSIYPCSLTLYDETNQNLFSSLRLTSIWFNDWTTTVTQEEFLQCFEQYGTVVNCVILYYRFTSRSRGFGFITFEDPHICQQLLQMKRIPMRSDKFVEIKEAQPRETTTQPNLTHIPHTKSRRGRNMGTMLPTAPFVPEMNHVMIGEPSMRNSSYTMGMTYGTVSDMPPLYMPVRRGPIDFVPPVASDVFWGPQHFYPSDAGHYCYNTPSVSENTTIVSNEGQLNNVFVQPSPMPTSHVHLPYDEPYDPYYGIYNSYISSTMLHDTSDELPPYSQSLESYQNSMPYYNSQYMPYLSEMVNHLERHNHPYDSIAMMHMPPSGSFYFPPSYIPTQSSLQLHDSKVECLSPTYDSLYDNVDARQAKPGMARIDVELESTTEPSLTAAKEETNGDQKSSIYPKSIT